MHSYFIKLLSGLEAAILETQKVLRNAVLRNQNGNEMSSLSSTDGEYRGLNVDSAREKLENLVSKGTYSCMEDSILIKNGT